MYMNLWGTGVAAYVSISVFILSFASSVSVLCMFFYFYRLIVLDSHLRKPKELLYLFVGVNNILPIKKIHHVHKYKMN